MKKLTTIMLLLIFVVLPITYAAGDFAYNRLSGLVEPIDVIVGDQTSPPILVYMNTVENLAVLSANFTIGSYNITINDSTGFSVGDYTGVFNNANLRFYAGTILSIDGNVLTMDTPGDFNYSIGNAVQSGNKEMNVDGSVTPQVYSLRADPELDITVDVTRIIIHITDNTAMDDATFGGISALERGIVLRKTDGTYLNIFNVKTNGEFGELAYDKTYDDKAPAGFFGFTSRLTFAGASKIGVAIRLEPDEDLQLIVQDDLTDLVSFRIMVEGHVVVP